MQGARLSLSVIARRSRRVLDGTISASLLPSAIPALPLLLPHGTAFVRRASSSASEMTHQRVKGRRRFYKTVTVREKADDGAASVETSSPRLWEVLLDGRVLKTPARRPLQFDSPELAMAVAAEWDAQVTKKGLEPALMPLMTLASTAIDQVALDREKTISTCLKYLPTDTVCFLAPDPDPVISRKQRQLWSPLRDWSNEALGIRVATTTEIHRKPQHPEEAIPRARDLLESMDEWALAAVQSVAMECKSLVIALALAFRETTVEKAFDAARLEEEFNVERWGLIEGGHDMDRTNTNLTLTAASTLLWLRKTKLPTTNRTAVRVSASSATTVATKDP